MCAVWRYAGLTEIPVGKISSKQAHKVRAWPNLRFKNTFVHCGKQSRLINRDVCVLGQYGVAEISSWPIFLATAHKVRAWPNLHFKIVFVHCGKQTRLINRDVCVLGTIWGCGKSNLADFLSKRPK